MNHFTKIHYQAISESRKLRDHPSNQYYLPQFSIHRLAFYEYFCQKHHFQTVSTFYPLKIIQSKYSRSIYHSLLEYWKSLFQAGPEFPIVFNRNFDREIPRELCESYGIEYDFEDYTVYQPLLGLYQNSLGCDLILTSEDDVLFYVHRDIIMARSQYFSAMLSRTWGGDVEQVSLKFISSRALTFIICYLYGGVLKYGFTSDNQTIGLGKEAYALYEVADMICLDGLILQIEASIYSELCHCFHPPCGRQCISNVIEAFDFLIEYGSPYLATLCHEWINKHLLFILPDFPSISPQLRDSLVTGIIINGDLVPFHAGYGKGYDLINCSDTRIASMSQTGHICWSHEDAVRGPGSKLQYVMQTLVSCDTYLNFVATHQSGTRTESQEFIVNTFRAIKQSHLQILGTCLKHLPLFLNSTRRGQDLSFYAPPVAGIIMQALEYMSPNDLHTFAADLNEIHSWHHTIDSPFYNEMSQIFTRLINSVSRHSRRIFRSMQSNNP